LKKNTMNLSLMLKLNKLQRKRKKHTKDIYFRSTMQWKPGRPKLRNFNIITFMASFIRMDGLGSRLKRFSKRSYLTFILF
jgi:hypothetical protein